MNWVEGRKKLTEDSLISRPSHCPLFDQRKKKRDGDGIKSRLCDASGAGGVGVSYHAEDWVHARLTGLVRINI